MFIDFDGTYADRGEVPARHVRVVQEARDNGHRVLLCTGRPRSMLGIDLLQRQFDGLVAGAGAYVEIGGRVLADQRFPPRLAARTLAVLGRYDVTYVLEAPDAVFAPPGARVRLARILRGALRPGSDPEGGSAVVFGSLRDVDDPLDCSFGKVTVFDSEVPVTELADLIGPGVESLPSSIAGWADRAGELYLTGVDKAVGIATAIADLRIDAAEVIAIGDGYNDLEMLSCAGTAVAVAGAPPELLAIADLVIPGPAEEGLVAGFLELGLISATPTGFA